MIRLQTVFLLLLFSPFLFAEETTTEAQSTEQAANTTTEQKPKPEYKQTPEEVEFYNAARAGRLDKLHILLDEGINVDMQNKQGRTPLMVATYKRNHGVIRELLAEGADIEMQDAKGKTVLMLAVLAQDDHMIKKLLSLGADKTVKDDADRTAEDYALMTDNKRIITIFRPEPNCAEDDEECLAAAEAEQVAQADTSEAGTEEQATATN